MTDFNIRLVEGPAGCVHVGFKVALLQVWAQIWDYLRSNRRGRALWITGHSLGAALATMATAKLRLELDEPVNGLYTYGGPRIGDRDFQRAFAADFERQPYRYINNSDVVTRIPTRSMGYSHVGFSKYFDRTGALRDDLSWADIVVDRFVGNVEDVFGPRAAHVQDHDLDGSLGYLENLERAAAGR